MVLSMRPVRHDSSCKAILKPAEVLNHENILIVPNFVVFQSAGSFEGCSLAEISEGGAVNEGHTAAILRQALCALVHLHNAGFAHGSVNCSNLYIEASTGLVKLLTEPRSHALQHLDGCSDSGEQPHSSSSGPFANHPSACRRPSLVATEIRMGRKSPADDIYAIGCTAASLLSGAQDDHSCHGSVSHFAAASVRRPAGLTLAAAAFLAECLAADPADRPAARELLGHPFLLLPAAGGDGAGGEDGSDGALAALLDDALVIDEAARRRPPPARPPRVPCLRASGAAGAASNGGVCFSSPSQTARAAAAAAAAAECCPLRRLMSLSAPADCAPRKRRAAAAAAAETDTEARRDRRRLSMEGLPLAAAVQGPAEVAAATAALAA